MLYPPNIFFRLVENPRRRRKIISILYNTFWIPPRISRHKVLQSTGFDRLAQRIECLTTDQVVLGSNPRSVSEIYSLFFH
jgi:hypothetical protein